MSASAQVSDRRTMLMASTGLFLTGFLAMPKKAPSVPSDVIPPGQPGKPGDFAFLEGNWKIQNRRLKQGTVSEWDEFEGEATCWSILDGAGSIEELRIPARDFYGMGLRLLDRNQETWNDFWVNAKSGALNGPPQSGRFQNGAGIFVAQETEHGLRIQVRGVWDQVTPESCRWTQSVSRDNGKTWQDNWVMTWQRVGGEQEIRSSSREAAPAAHRTM